MPTPEPLCHCACIHTGIRAATVLISSSCAAFVGPVSSPLALWAGRQHETQTHCPFPSLLFLAGGQGDGAGNGGGVFLPNMELPGACPQEGPNPGRLSLGTVPRRTSFYPRSQAGHTNWSLTVTLCFGCC